MKVRSELSPSKCTAVLVPLSTNPCARAKESARARATSRVSDCSRAIVGKARGNSQTAMAAATNATATTNHGDLRMRPVESWVAYRTVAAALQLHKRKKPARRGPSRLLTLVERALL